MGLDLRQVHRDAVRVDESTGQKHRVRVIENPYIRINQGDGPPIFVQGGIAYAEGGDKYALDAFPPWFIVRAKNVGEVAAKECGLDRLIHEIENFESEPLEEVTPEPETPPGPEGPSALDEILSGESKSKPKPKRKPKGQFTKAKKE